ncbi:MAG TPA: DNA polymerase III subunit gamma/tau C-terminal domain-containing protein, partial [Rheinheimera sp.]|nr:DNA polymerase III subunit gamma/tau C-terminal domain-containing protein [Rheinheimera sp.]
LPYAPDPLTGLEMALLRAMVFIPETKSRTAPPQPLTAVAPLQSPATADAQRPLSAMAVEKAAAKTDVRQTDEVSAAAVAASMLSDSSENATGIDAVTARIMARRGVQVTAAAPAKKSERQQAPVSAAQAAETSEAKPSLPEAATATTVVADNSPVLQPAVSLPQPQAADNHEAQDHGAESREPYDDSDIPEYDAGAADSLWQQYEQDMQHGAVVSPTPEEPRLDQFDGSINEQNFSVRFAAQVDAWAARVETLDTGGLSRLFLLNAAMALNGNTLSLTVAQSQQHLDSEGFRVKLQQVLEHSFNQTLQIEITYQAEVPNSPLVIQQKIVQERLVYVSRLLQQDDKVLQLQKMFDAQLLTDSIVVN